MSSTVSVAPSDDKSFVSGRPMGPRQLPLESGRKKGEAVHSASKDTSST